MLRDDVFAALAAQQPSPVKLPIAVPVLLDSGVLWWSARHHRHEYLIDVRDDVAIAWNVAKSPAVTREAIATFAGFLAGISAAELAATSVERPMRRFDEPRGGSHAMDAFAVVHPSCASYRISKLADELLLPRTYVAFPCFRCEVAGVMDAAWSALQYARIGWSDLERSPVPAVRAAPCSARGQNQPREPARASTLESVLRGPPDARTADDFEVENFRGEVMRISAGPDAVATLRPFLLGVPRDA